MSDMHDSLFHYITALFIIVIITTNIFRSGQVITIKMHSEYAYTYYIHASYELFGGHQRHNNGKDAI